MPKVSDEHRAAQRERIKDATIAVLHRQGFAGLNMGDVIRESGLSAGAIYAYFKNKEELVRSVAAELVSGRVDALDDLAAQSPLPNPSELIRAMLGSLPEHLLESGLIPQIWGSAAHDPTFQDLAHASLRDMESAVTRYLTRWLAQEGIPDAETRAAAMAPAALGLIQGYVVRIALDGMTGGRAYLDGIEAMEAGLRLAVPRG